MDDSDHRNDNSTDKIIESDQLVNTDSKNLLISRAYQHSPDPFIITNFQEGRILFINDALTKQTGYEASDLVGKITATTKVWVSETDLSRYREILSSDGIVENFFTQFRHKDGEEHPYVISGKLFDLNGATYSTLSIKDMAPFRVIEEAFEKSERKYRALVETSQDLIWQADDRGRFIYLNRAWEKTHGYSIEEMLGRPFTDFMTPETAARDVQEFGRHLAGGSVKGYQTTHIAKNGDPIHLVFNAIPRKDEAGRIIGAQGTAHDVTNLKKAETELLKIEKLESLCILAGGIAHDFNNILTALWGNISLARMNTNESEENREILIEAENACRRARDLTKQLQAFAKGGSPSRKVISLKDVITQSAGFTLRGSNVRAKYEISEDLWNVEADEGQMSQVVNNLVLNAAQAMPNGGVIVVRATNAVLDPQSIASLSGSGRYVTISIEDKGPGINSEHLTKIFDPYFTTKQKGCGLGLTTCYSIVMNHEGHIEVKSEVGKGTTFNVYIPASDKVLAVSDAFVPIGVNAGIKRVLIMDDDDGVRNFLTKILKRMGYEVDDAIEGGKAIEMYLTALQSGKRYDVVILDLTVPGGMGGRETIFKLKELDPNVTAIVASGYFDDPVMANPAQYGFKGVAAKPVQAEELSNIIKALLN